MGDRLRITTLVLAASAAWGLTCVPTAFAASGPQGDGSIWTRSHLFGDWGGIRPWLKQHEISIGAVESAAPSAILHGGERQGTAYAGLLTLSADANLAPETGISGLSVHVTSWIVQGNGASANGVGSLSGLAYVAAQPGARLGDAFLELQAPHDAVRVKAGQFGLDENFDLNPDAGVFLNSTFTYRNIMADQLPGGGPAYSYEGPGIMAGVQATPRLRLKAAIFSGDPLGQPVRGPAPPARDGNGLAFPLNTGVLAIAEGDWSYRLPGLGKGLFALGGLYDTLNRPDLLHDASGQSLAQPDAGPPRQDHGQYVLYADDNQTLWRGRHGRRLRGFVRLAYAPPDRDLISFDVQGGLVAYGPIPSRPQDQAGFAVAYDRISRNYVTRIEQQNALTGGAAPVPSGETDIVLDYAAQVTPWLVVTPDIQYIINPGGGAPLPYDSNRAIPNALVAQTQLQVTF